MPAWNKPPAALVTLFAKATGRLMNVETRTMFGYPAVFAGGHMFAGSFATGCFCGCPIRPARSSRPSTARNPSRPRPDA